ncbi:hypothetical protein SDC9_20938 [bioreactor metagenome]|uniref:Branched-chain amino acid transport protein (AzlD) n=1 Tax=bioreactor metagenome TaxID=1076179 RepID=A0A644U845_9ZZZZ|nr:AzlD domain-containing protein [Negativicutes bacterium]
MELILLVIMMAVVTYLPRMLPMVVLQKMTLPPFIRRFLRFVPFAALGALIFPGILTSTGPDNLLPATFGGLISVALALGNANLILVVIGGILGAFIGSVYL